MFNLTIPEASPFLGLDGGGLCTTPRTPELVNTLIAMSNPLDNVTFTARTVDSMNFNLDTKQSSQNSNHSSGCGSPLNSPATVKTPTFNQTKSQLIKAGLKISIQSKRKRPASTTISSFCDSSSNSGSGSEIQTSDKYCKHEDDSSEEEMFEGSKGSRVGLTAEDEDRRKRRRERNKIAATKCRLKKRERTNNLIKESEQLDNQNVDLKSQVKTLELERRSLLEMLQCHSPVCSNANGFSISNHLCQSPAYKYFNQLDLNDSSPSNEQRKSIPPMSTIKYSRNENYKRHHQHQQHPPQQQQQQQQQQQPDHITLPSLIPSHLSRPNLTSKLSAINQEIELAELISNSNMQALQIQQSDFVQNCESCCNDDITSTSEFVKIELVDSQSPYTTAQSAERFLFESNSERLDIKQQINNNTNMLNNNNIIDFHRFTDSASNSASNSNSHSHLNQSPYDPLLNKHEFLTDEAAELLNQVNAVDASVSELTDLDTGYSSTFQMTNEECLS